MSRGMPWETLIYCMQLLGLSNSSEMHCTTSTASSDVLSVIHSQESRRILKICRNGCILDFVDVQYGHHPPSFADLGCAFYVVACLSEQYPPSRVLASPVNVFSGIFNRLNSLFISRPDVQQQQIYDDGGASQAADKLQQRWTAMLDISPRPSKQDPYLSPDCMRMASLASAHTCASAQGTSTTREPRNWPIFSSA